MSRSVCILQIAAIFALAYVGLPQAAEAAVTYVQGNFGTPTAASTVSVAYTVPQGAGDLNVIFVAWSDASSTVQSITDSKGNTYVAAIGPSVNPGNNTQVVYYAKNIASATAGVNTVTVTFSRSVSYPDVRILEYSGINAINPVDAAVSAYGNGENLDSGSLTTTTANDLLLASGSVQHSYTGGPGSGYTKVLASDWNLVENAMVTTTGAYNATSTATSGYWVMQLVAFRAAATGGETLPPSTPTDLIATSGSSSQVNLAWRASRDNVGVSGYLIERCTGTGCSSFSQVGTSSATIFADTGLDTSTAYRYRVRASDAVGNLSGYSYFASVTTAVAAAGFVQGNSRTSTSASSISVTYPAAQIAGDLNAVFVGWSDATSTVQSIADSKGNTYVAAVGPTVSPGNATQRLYYAKNIAGAAAGANTISVTFSGPVSYPDVRILELKGIDTTSPFDVGVGAYGNGTALNSGGLTTTGPNELLVASGYVQHTQNGVGAGYTKILASDWNLVEDAIANVAGDYSATSTSSSGYWVMQLAAFRSANPGDVSAPSAPSSLVAVATSNSRADLTWAASGDNVAVAGYFIERCEGVDCTDFVQIGTSLSTAYDDTGLTPLNIFSYRVRAVDSANNASAYSRTAIVYTNGDSGSGGPGGGSGPSTSSSTTTYDTNGRVSTVTTVGGGATHYVYDAAGNLISIQTTP
ncbi:MAG: fibronectin type III domain-containing protein [Steroidobacteraceae bacterium]